jgi:hypothetical protein
MNTEVNMPEPCTCTADIATVEDETFIVRVPITARELLELRDDLEWGERVLGPDGLRSMVDAHGIRMWHRLAKRVLEGAGRLRR